MSLEAYVCLTSLASLQAALLLLLLKGPGENGDVSVRVIKADLSLSIQSALPR